LLNRYRLVKAYRGFESLRLRQNRVRFSAILYDHVRKNPINFSTLVACRRPLPFAFLNAFVGSVVGGVLSRLPRRPPWRARWIDSQR
jgi:hypothetical protein